MNQFTVFYEVIQLGPWGYWWVWLP